MGNPWNIRPYKKANGTTSYNLRVRRKGQLHTETFLSASAAQRAGIKIASQMDDGKYVGKNEIQTDDMTFSEALDKLLTIPNFINLKGYGVECDRANKMKEYKFTKLAITKIRSSDLAAYRDGIWRMGES